VIDAGREVPDDRTCVPRDLFRTAFCFKRSLRVPRGWCALSRADL